MTTSLLLRGLGLLAGLAGASSIACAAAAAHGGAAALLQPAAFMLGTTAPALLAIALAGGGRRTLLIGGYALAIGASLFAGDMVFRTFASRALFPSAAPIGGVIAMAGWAVLGLGAVVARSAPSPSSHPSP